MSEQNADTPQDPSELLTHTESLINRIHCFVHDLEHPPGASHRGVAINVVDLQEQRSDFLAELRNTASAWVYSRSEYNRIFQDELRRRGSDVQNAASTLNHLVKTKFRKGHPQGQFGELLLFNFIQHFFGAVPLLRKMPITTNPNIERHGADAIHYLAGTDKNYMFLGEAKAYKSDYRFKSAFRDGLSSILSCYQNIGTELDLYVHDRYVDESLKEVARSLKNGTLSNVKYELVLIVAYNEKKDKECDCEDEIKTAIEDIVAERFGSVPEEDCAIVENRLISRLHYVVFPVWEFGQLLSDFEDLL